MLLVSVSSIESHRLSKSASLRSARVRTVHFTMEENPLFCLLSHYSNLKRPEAPILYLLVHKLQSLFSGDDQDDETS